MLLGIGGGLGMGYILWEFLEHRGQRDARVLVLAFQNNWQYTDRSVEGICQRLRLRFRSSTTGSPRIASRTLHEALARSDPAVAWVDGASMPYLQLPEPMRGHYAHIVAVCGTNADDVLVDDLAAQPFAVPADVLAEARARIPSFKHRLLLVEGAGDIDIEAAVAEGMAACAEHLSSSSESFSLAAIRKWAKVMTDRNNRKGWPVVFRDRHGLYSALSSIFEALKVQGATGGLRGMYSDFLAEAAEVVGDSRFQEPAERYAALAKQWDELAEEALPDAVPQFERAKQALRTRHEVLMTGGEAWRTTATLTEELRAISSDCDLSFPLDDQETSVLFSALQARLQAIYLAEVEAVESLKRSLGGPRR
jgi:uncharacterized protein DUF4872/butirosin biosynthesis protein H-like